VLTLTVTADEPMALVVFTTVSCRAEQTVSASFAVDSEPIAPSLEAELSGATLPISMHGRTTLAPGTHRIAVMLESEQAFDVEERLLTAMLYREAP
jgi:hypothetical protein